MSMLRQSARACQPHKNCSRAAAPHPSRLHSRPCRPRPLAAHQSEQQPSREELGKQKQPQQPQPQQQQHSPRALDSGTEEEQQQRAEELLQELVAHPQDVEQLLLEAAEREGDMCVSPAYIDAIVDAITHPEIGSLDHQATQESTASRPKDAQQL